MHETCDGEYADQERRPNCPGGREGQGIGQLFQFFLKALQYVLPHDTKYRTETPDEPCGFIVFRTGQVADQLASTILTLDRPKPDKIFAQGDLIFARANRQLGFLKFVVSGLHQ